MKTHGEAEEVRYELTLSRDEARCGTKKILTKQGNKLEVNIPPGTKDGNTVKLPNLYR